MNLKESREGGKGWMKERVVLIISETHTWPSEAAWAWTSPWPPVAVPVTQISMASSGPVAHGHQHGFRWQQRP